MSLGSKVFGFGFCAVTLAHPLGCSSDPSSTPDSSPAPGSLTGGTSTLSGGVTHSGGAIAASGGTATNAGSVSAGGRGSSTATGGSPGKASGGSSGAGGRTSSAGKTGGGGNPSSAGAGGDESVEGGAAGSGAGGSDRPGWTLVFADEFEGAKGTPVNSENWNLVNRGDGFGNNELQFYTNRTENASLDGNGSLAITAIEEDYMNRAYTSARLESNGKIEITYGRIEGRIKVPSGQGIWPAFWMLGNDIGDVSWPQCGEIDVMENIGKEPTIVHGTLHGPGYSGGNPLGASYSLPDGAPFKDDFHVFAVEWEKDVVRFYVNDTLYKTRTPDDVPDGGRWVYDHPFYLLLNVAVGGNWPGSPDQTTTFPQTMLVDYVRIYER